MVREDIGEASVGDRIGQPLSREIDVILGADAVPLAEGNMDDSLRGNREISCLTRAARLWSAPGRRGTVAGDARA